MSRYCKHLSFNLKRWHNRRWACGSRLTQAPFCSLNWCFRFRQWDGLCMKHDRQWDEEGKRFEGRR